MVLDDHAVVLREKVSFEEHQTGCLTLHDGCMKDHEGILDANDVVFDESDTLLDGQGNSLDEEIMSLVDHAEERKGEDRLQKGEAK